ncbi:MULTISPECIES: YoaK family protein [unclassified Enterococcus]|uniref:YoaK family protein n=1 Tax=unclassified Enterococcus TaxID=2608891 RepID=UPI00155608E7|nr:MULTISPECIES: YoaK family protein [unclassified Enterococcus]MBS7578338.1 DUF1275 domain-containing protein [Enterococcus sp. MMGLQ5-2]MBS7585575.1 DUF1275 domain-containing protein [Enterococcus sp. MMGLQ5-1]NPD13434.1 DUF1275 domain-containing protein [Enterococcus sp. MMGLQ5-1]NPD38169.1 DUF1275 domain-containing protein [Enterococcus sp. MMGLQ5-2]
MKINFHENRLVGLLLTFIGGMLDSYTYIHYGAFASAQTGNLILAIIEAYDHNWESVGKKLLSTAFFFIGIMLAKFMIDYFNKKKFHFWRLALLYLQALIFFILNLSLLQLHPSIVTIIIAFTAAIQWTSFDKINGLAYTNLFTTGNLKGLASNLYDYLKTKDNNFKERSIHFLSVVIVFILGVIVSVYLYHQYGRHMIISISGLFLCLAISQTILILRFFREARRF